MSGLPLQSALNLETLGAVFRETLFGRVSEIRFGLAVALGATLFRSRRRDDDRGWLILGTGGGLLAAALLGTLAWTGHAAAEQGIDRYIHLLADVVHLLAAGAWLGALPPLLFLLTRSQCAPSAETLRLAAQVTARFSILGLISVGALVVTGTANALYTVGTVPALLGTPYGGLLLTKLALFGTMVALAAINRFRLTPQLAAASNMPSQERALVALRWLRRNAAVEIALGLVIVTLVGALGVTIPGRHVQPVWPFPYTVDWALIEESAGPPRVVFVASLGAVLGLALTLLGVRSRRWITSILGLGGFVSALAAVAWSFSVPAYPTTYVQSPVSYASPSIARGASLFARHCALCHGPYGYGDGPAAASLPVKPANLTEHALRHREGDLFWWIKHGIAGTRMPGFGDQMSEIELWDTISFLRAQAQAEESKAMDDMVEPWGPIVAPDFAFQIDGQPQESLKQQRGRHVVLLVFYTLPESFPRLHVLTDAKRALGSAGARVIAVPMNSATSAARDAEAHGVDASILGLSDSRLVAVYLMFGRTVSVERVPTHMEFLVDRQGYLRARWTPGAGRGWDQLPVLMRQIEALTHERPHPPPVGVGHAHH